MPRKKPRSCLGSEKISSILISCEKCIFRLLHCAQPTKNITSAWPAISNVCLVVRTVPVLTVAKEVAALPADPMIALAADRPNSGRAKRTADRSTIECEEILSVVCLLMFPFLLEVIMG